MESYLHIHNDGQLFHGHILRKLRVHFERLLQENGRIYTTTEEAPNQWSYVDADVYASWTDESIGGNEAEEFRGKTLGNQRWGGIAEPYVYDTYYNRSYYDVHRDHFRYIFLYNLFLQWISCKQQVLVQTICHASRFLFYQVLDDDLGVWNSDESSEKNEDDTLGCFQCYQRSIRETWGNNLTIVLLLLLNCENSIVQRCSDCGCVMYRNI